MNERPKIGLATIIRLNQGILLGKRRNPHGDETLSFPGGPLELFETFEECSRRETLKETGLELFEDFILIKNFPITVTNDFFKEENEHYLTLYMIANQRSSKLPKLMEPDKWNDWCYYTWDEIKGEKYKLSLHIKNLIKQDFNPYEI